MPEEFTNLQEASPGNTGNLDPQALEDTAEFEAVEYLSYPYPAGSISTDQPVWRVRFDVLSGSTGAFGLDINGEVILGRGSSVANLLDLSSFDAVNMGVSRQHVALRPESAALYLVDLGSTNGTRHNGQLVKVDSPASLSSGDTLILGQLQLVVRIFDTPADQPDALERKADLADAMVQVAMAITSQQTLDEVLTKVVEAARSLTGADEAGIWLVDEPSGDLFLEAEQGQDDTGVRRQRLPLRHDTLVSRAYHMGKPIRASRDTDDEDTMSGEAADVKSVLYLPLKLDTIFGVMSVEHRTQGNRFTERDERLLGAIADFAVIALQNARLIDALAAERATIHATVEVLDQPLLILDPVGNVMLSNQAANALIAENGLAIIDQINAQAEGSDELTVGDSVYLAAGREVRGLILVMQDITYVKNLERDRAEFMRALSHDLKSPLTSIRGWAHLIPRVEESMSEKGLHYVDQVVESANRMNEMITRLVQGMSLSEGVSIKQRPVSVDDMLRSVVQVLEGAALTREISLAVDIQGDPVILMGDEDRLYHMALNLIDNAVKYSPDSSRVDIQLRFTPQEISLVVADEGQGIPEDEIDQIFGKYFRGRQSADSAFGVGLGLAVVQTTVNLHEGTVSVANRPTGGAEFTVRLPVNP